MKYITTTLFLLAVAALSPAPTYLHQHPNIKAPHVQSLAQREAEQAQGLTRDYVGEAQAEPHRTSQLLDHYTKGPSAVAGAGQEISGAQKSGATVVREAGTEVESNTKSPMRTLIWTLFVVGCAFGSVHVFRLWADKNLPQPQARTKTKPGW